MKTGLEVLVWSEVWLGPIVQTSWASSLAGVFSKNRDGLLCLGAPFSMYAILLRRLLKPASVLEGLGTGCDGWMSSVGLACLRPAVAFGRVEAGWDYGISSSEAEWLFCGYYLIGEIGSGLSLISASMAMM